ncbi:IS110 family transposase [Rhodococcus sp. PAE-6]|uniref:IS110 family transposase n=1 Tax=Rhodococcus sp. PAE-6 TaxID=2972477 RepID=UPI0021B42311|nr:IS110 family transposase [Rhodococcus sp. PAE-6]MCT7294273.1 IS110 family transposase [Rhodococcus sp. PAE-6]
MTTPLVEVINSAPDREIVAGVDTHSDTHPLAVLGITGTRLGDLQVPATSAGYEQLLGYIRSRGSVRLVGIEGTSSYGAGLSRYLRTHNVEIREIIRPRRSQRRRGKSDPIDAYAAAQQTLAEPDTLPQAKTGDGLVEQIRVLLAVRRSAVKARVAVIRQITSLLVTAPDPVRARWAGANERRMVEELAATRPGVPTASVGAATGYALRRREPSRV